MAYSEVNTLEDHLTCSVCLEIFRNPHVLQCLHTFCYQCVQDLQIKNRVKCPSCREVSLLKDLKKNFHLEGIVASFQQSHQKQSIIHTIQCDVCGGFDTAIESYCTQCEELLCQPCSRAHSGSKASKAHKLTPFVELNDSTQRQMEYAMTLVSAERERIGAMVSTKHNALQNAQKEIYKQVEAVNLKRMKVLAESADAINRHHDNLVERVKTMNSEALFSLEVTVAKLTSIHLDLEEKSKSLNASLEKNNYKEMTESLKTFYAELAQLKSEVSTFIENSERCTALTGTGMVQPEWQAPEPRAKALKVKAMFHYTPDKTDELSLGPGEVIEVVPKDKYVPGWLFGIKESSREEGYFPDNFIERL